MKKELYNTIKNRIQPYPKTDIKKPDMQEKEIVEEAISNQDAIQLNLFDNLGGCHD